jgi:hypothetical protein
VKAAAIAPRPPTAMLVKFVEPAQPGLVGEAAVVVEAPEVLDEDRLGEEAVGCAVVTDAMDVVSPPVESVPDMKVTSEIGNELVMLDTP